MVAIPKRWRDATVTVHDPSWDARETVTLKSYYSDADRAAVLSASTQYSQDAAGQTVMKTTLDEMARCKRTRAIKSWTLQDADGDPLPMDADTIANLPIEVAAYIDGEIDALWAGLAAKTPAQAQEAKAEQAELFRPDEGAAERPESHNGADDAEAKRKARLRRASPAL